MESMRRWPARLGRAALDALLPPVSPITRDPVGAPGDVSPEIWSRLSFIDPPHCARCGTPFAFAVTGAMICGACSARPPRFDRARAALLYDDHSRDLILSFKHGGRRDCLPAFADWMARAGAELLKEADLITPVPLHYARLVRRRYNQSAILARALAGRCGAAFDADSLMRSRRTPSQAGKSLRGRRRNVAGAFALRDGARERLSARRVLLIDDVFTTGATLNACARALRSGGASGVDALCLARVAKPLDPLA